MNVCDVEIWRIACADHQEKIKFFSKVLSKEEMVRVDNFRFEIDRKRFIIAHGVLRCLLSDYLGNSPQEIQFLYTNHGKPCLKSSDTQQRLEFNLSYSQDLILLAVSSDMPVGVDIEKVKRDSNCMEIAKACFSRAELEQLINANIPDRARLFYKYWTCKEAYLKAKSEGLSYGLNKFEITTNLQGNPVLARDEIDENAPNRWCIKEVETGKSYIAHVAVETDEINLTHAQYRAPVYIDL